jgi:hypothetical protein
MPSEEAGAILAGFVKSTDAAFKLHPSSIKLARIPLSSKNLYRLDSGQHPLQDLRL